MRILFFSLWLLGASIAQADQVKIDFSESGLPSWGGVEGFGIKNYQFTFGPARPTSYGAFQLVDPAWFPTKSMNVNPGYYAELERFDGAAFSLYNFGIAPWATGTTIFEITGYFENGSTLLETIAIQVGSPPQITLNWNGLLRVKFDSLLETSPFSIDNVTVSAIPLPGAMWLLGSALAGLVWVRRQSTR